jgi:Ca2+:H+ antiporter
MAGTHASMPWWSWAAPIAACALLAAKAAGLADPGAASTMALAALLLGGAVFAAVHHAEIVALRVGEPFGSVILAVAVTVIEVALIVSIMLSAPDGGREVARDTVFAAVMIVLNGIVGLCLLVGGIRHHEQGFHAHGASAALGVLGTLAALVLILPNYTSTIAGPVYAPSQLVFVAVVSLALYALFLFVQTVRHRNYFLDAADDAAGTSAPAQDVRPGNRLVAVSLGLLVVSLTGVILLAKTLSPAIDRAIAAAGLPDACVGIVIAAVVLLPEGMAAYRAAHANRLQTSLNLALGSALASIGLTIPAVTVVSLALGIPLALGLQPQNVVLLVLSLFAATITLATGRTTVLQGGVHMVIFGAFLVIAAVP